MPTGVCVTCLKITSFPGISGESLWVASKELSMVARHHVVPFFRRRNWTGSMLSLNVKFNKKRHHEWSSLVAPHSSLNRLIGNMRSNQAHSEQADGVVRTSVEVVGPERRCPYLGPDASRGASASTRTGNPASHPESGAVPPRGWNMVPEISLGASAVTGTCWPS